MSAARREVPWPLAAIQILSYLVRHPRASDTLEGVAEWWVLRETVARGVAETAGALEFLVSRDLVTEECSGEDRPRYRLNQQRLDEIVELVEDRDRHRRRPDATTAVEPNAPFLP